MKKERNSKWQKQLLFVAIASVVLVFAANSPASTQTGNYKVGDRVEAQQAGDWSEVEILEVKDNGYYVIRFVKSGETLGWWHARYLRPIKAKEQTNNRTNAGNQAQNQTNGNAQATTGGVMAATQEKQSIGGRFGSREPRTCDDTKAPAGAITAALAQKYLKCQMEMVTGNLLYLVENVKVEVGGGVPYAAIIGHRSFSQIDVKHLVYPIRGSLLRYQCADPVREHVGSPDTSCHTYNEPKATGYCYKTTFGDWICNMSDGAGNNIENYSKDVAPPR